MKSPLDAGLSGAPGHSTDSRRHRMLDDGAANYIVLPAISWCLAIAETFGALFDVPRMPAVFLIGAIAATVYGVHGIITLRCRSESMKLGRDGEREVAHRLSMLAVPGCRVFHDVPADGFNLDHVVICDRSIFVIETKTWRKPVSGDHRIVTRAGQVFRAGRPVRSDPVRQVTSAARWLAELLKRKTGRDFRCQPVLVFPGWMIDPMDDATKSMAWVLNPKALLKFVEHERVTLGSEEVHLVADSLLVHLKERAEG